MKKYPQTIVIQFSNSSDADFNVMMKEYFSLESIRVSPSKNSISSQEERNANDIIQSKMKLIGNRYKIDLLWRTVIRIY